VHSRKKWNGEWHNQPRRVVHAYLYGVTMCQWDIAWIQQCKLYLKKETAILINIIWNMNLQPRKKNRGCSPTHHRCMWWGRRIRPPITRVIYKCWMEQTEWKKCTKFFVKRDGKERKRARRLFEMVRPTKWNEQSQLWKKYLKLINK